MKKAKILSLFLAFALVFSTFGILAPSAIVSAADGSAKNGIVQDSDGIRYYVNGTYQTGWQTIDGRKVYFFGATGLMCDYDRTIGGEYTEFETFTYNGLTLYAKKGALKNGPVQESDGIRYYVNDVRQTGWQTIDGRKVYFFTATGLMCKIGRAHV